MTRPLPHFTRLALSLAFALTLPLATAIFAQQPPLNGTLHWTNGDKLEGVLSSGAGQQLLWGNALLFADPLQLRIEALEAIDFAIPKNEAKAGDDGRYRASMLSGDVIHGDLESIDATHVVLKSQRHGVLRLKRSEIVSLRRLDHPSLIFVGPNGREGWKSLNRRYAIDLWSNKPGGGLETKRWRSELFQAMRLPDQVEAEIVIKSSQRPEFTLAFDENFNESLRLETWDDVLVAIEGTNFEPLLTFDENTRLVHLRLLWDRTTGSLAVHAGDGELLAQMKSTPPAADQKGNPGFYLRNKTLDMELTKLRIGRWSGQAPERVRENEPRIRLIDGGFVYGEVGSLAAAAGPMTLASGENVATDAIDTIHFRQEGAAVADPDKGVKATYGDGCLITGKLLSIDKDGFAKIETVYSDEPVLAQLAGARRLEFEHPDDLAIAEPTDELQMEKLTLHGTISGSNDPKSPIRWRPFGGVEAVPVKAGADARMVRMKTEAVSDLEGDRIFLNSREIISCHVDAIDDEFVHFNTSMSTVRRLPVGQVTAIEFREGRLQLIGFGDRGWTKVLTKGGKTTREPERVTLDGGGLAHASILRANEIAFNVRWENSEQGGLSIGLFGNSVLPDAPSPLNISFSCWTNRLWVAGAEPGMANMMGGQDTNITGGQADIRIRVDGDRVRVWVNENQLANLTHDSQKRLGNGLRFGIGGPWFDGSVKLSKVVITDFEVRSTTGLLAPLRVDQEAKEQALTIPRFRKDNPATHILIAPTGDMLRGRLTGVSNDLIRFASRLDTLDFPRDRVAGLISLKADELDPGITDEETRIVLSDGSAIRLTPEKMDEQLLAGTSPSLGAVKLPAAAIRQIHLGRFKPIPDQLVYADWKQTMAKFPEIPEAGGSGGQPSDLIGKDAAEVKLPLLGGEEFVLAEQKGKIVVLEFWATWCGPCVRAFPEYVDALARIDSDEVRFVAINQGEPANVIEPFLDRHGWDFEVALDARQTTGQKYGVEGIPHTVVIDRQGKIVWVHSGFLPGVGDEFEKVIKDLLAAKPAEPDAAPKAEGEADPGDFDF